MIKKVSIQMSQGWLCAGVAVFEKEGKETCIFFDVVKSNPFRVIVGNRGPKLTQVDPEDADRYEEELLDLFLKHNLPFKLGTYAITA